MNSYEEKQAARKERMLDRADRLRTTGRAKIDSGMSALRAIPFGQPILIGHHSEKRDRSYRAKAGARIDRGMETVQIADDVERRANAVGTGGISSDDPDATVKLTSQLASLKASQRQMLAINKAWVKAGSPAADDLPGWQKVADAPDVMMNVNDLSNVRMLLARKLVVRPFPSYSLSNNSANIRRIEQRIAHLARNAARVTTQRDVAGVRIVENAEINRLQLIFPGKPSEAVRTLLKRNGFRWSPSEGAWQKHLNGWAASSATYIVNEIAKLEAPNQPPAQPA